MPRTSEQIRVYKRDWARRHRKQQHDWYVPWYEKNKSQILARHRKRYADRQEQEKLRSKKYRELHPEVRRAYKKRKLLTDPHFRFKEVACCRIRQAVKMAGAKKSAKSIILIGCTWLQLRQHIERQFKPNMTWENYGEWQIDHILPCASFDLTKEEDQKKCFHYTNLQPLWAKENREKSDKIFNFDNTVINTQIQISS